MFSVLNKLLSGLFVILFWGITLSFAKIDVEMEGMEVDSRDDGTFLVGSPTFYFDRILGAGGLHSESELWTPYKLRNRLLFNRLSILPSWEIYKPSLWLKTGNELGDLIYQDFITIENRPGNRTPILEGGFRTPNFKNFWVTGRAFQDDHFSTTHLSLRKKWVDDEFSHFGENYPMFSSFYAGFGYEGNVLKASFLAGEEYLWYFSESSRWIPVHLKPRLESRIDVASLAMTLAYENQEYQNKGQSESGNRKQWNGSILYKCDEFCQRGIFQISSGITFRMVEDSGMVYTHLKGNNVFLPFVNLKIIPDAFFSIEGMFAINDRDWLTQDSVEFTPPTPDKSTILVGIKNISGTRLNPLADNEEFFDGDTISLKAKGSTHLIQGYGVFIDTIKNISIGGKASYWAQYGAETFDVSKYVRDGSLVYRYGNVSRIHSWVKGITGELWVSYHYQDFFKFKGLGGFERIEGDERKFEINPVDFFSSFSADWLIKKSFRISHSLRYRSDARWNLRTEEPLMVKGDWFWDATFEQQFPKQKLYLTGTLIHVLGDEIIETPNGAENRLRFICTIKKLF